MTTEFVNPCLLWLTAGRSHRCCWWWWLVAAMSIAGCPEPVLYSCIPPTTTERINVLLQLHHPKLKMKSASVSNGLLPLALILWSNCVLVSSDNNIVPDRQLDVESEEQNHRSLRSRGMGNSFFLCGVEGSPSRGIV